MIPLSLTVFATLKSAGGSFFQGSLEEESLLKESVRTEDALRKSSISGDVATLRDLEGLLRA
jgi:hypothetical protein